MRTQGERRFAAPTRLAPAVATAFVLLAVGCGGNGDGAVATSTVTETTTTEVEPAVDTNAKPQPKPPTRAEKVEAVVAGYYAAVDARRFGAAWDLLAPTLQTEQGGYGPWKAGYATTVATRATAVEVVDLSSTAATVALELEATDSDACGDLVDQSFSGTWSLARINGGFLGTAFDVAKIGGGTPVTDPASCTGGGAGGGDPVVPVGCDPNYTGCVPPYPPDVDCIDVGQEVDVIGEDVHNLDVGGDAQACEIYFR